MSQPVRRVALLLQGWGGWHAQLIRGVQAYAHTAPHWRLHVDGGLPGTSRAESGLVQWDGIISSGVYADALLRKLRRSPATKIVGLSSSQVHGPKTPVVRVDDERIVEFLGQHLLAGGLRQIGYLGPQSWGRSDRRGEAVRQFLERRGLPFHSLTVKRPEQYRLVSAFPMRQVVAWVRKLPRPFGLIVWNMAAAHHVVEACVRAGLTVPRDAAVVAADDDPVLSESSSPTITGLAFPAERIAYRGAELLEDLMAGKQPPAAPILIPPTNLIHVRESSDTLSLPNREVHLAVQFIREHARESLKVAHVARHVGVSRSRLDEKFMEVLGHTPHEELVLAHLARARQLLVDTAWTMERVAREAGFGTSRTLYRTFIERLQMTPAAYRARFGEPSGPVTGDDPHVRKNVISPTG